MVPWPGIQYIFLINVYNVNTRQKSKHNILNNLLVLPEKFELNANKRFNFRGRF